MQKLYIRNGCPYCKKVLDYVKENNISLETKEITDSENASELVKYGGKQQVPFLFDSEKSISLYDSDEIIKYLKG